MKNLYGIYTLIFCVSFVAYLCINQGETTMSKKPSLAAYKKKRNFTKTPEPKPTIARSGKKHIFVIQQHHASRMHYDFRLEVDGVLKSWAIPKGPSLDPKDKRLAAQVEDHPLAYAKFEGVIPSGYGAGTVIVWDTGTYENKTEKKGEPISIQEGLENGHITIELQGKKLKGEYALIRFRGEEKNWLLIKADDEYADARRNVTESEPKSVLSGVTIKELDKKFDRKKK